MVQLFSQAFASSVRTSLFFGEIDVYRALASSEKSSVCFGEMSAER